MIAESAPPLRWYQYRLRTLLGLTTAMCVALAAWNTYVAPYRSQRRAAGALAALGAKIESRPDGPAWLRWAFGDANFMNVVAVDLQHRRFTDDDLAPLAGLPHLERLYLADTPLTSAGLRHVRGLTKLRRLALWGTRITDDGLANLRGLDDLEVLDIHSTKLTEASLEHLRDLTSLKRLICGMSFSDRGLARLKELELLEVADTLFLKGVTDAGMEHLRSATNLDMLEIDSHNVSDVGIQHLRGLHNLSILDIRRCGITDASLGVVAQLPTLNDVRLVHTRVTLEGVAKHVGQRFSSIDFFEHCTRLRGDPALCDSPLWLEYVGQVTGDDMASIGEFPNVRIIAFQVVALSEAVLPHLPALGKLQHLTLMVRDCDARLRHLERVPSLRSLDLAGNGVFTNAGLDCLARLVQLDNLSVSRHELADAQLGFLDNLTNLYVLDLSGNRLNEPGLVHLERLTKLVYLVLSHNQRLGGESLGHVAGLKALQRLELEDTDVNDAGLVHLYRLPELKDVRVRDSRVSDRGRAELYAVLKANKRAADPPRSRKPTESEDVPEPPREPSVLVR